MSFTLYIRNELTGHQRFQGTHETQDAAIEARDRNAAKSRSFVTFEVWTGTATNPIKPVLNTQIRGKA